MKKDYKQIHTEPNVYETLNRGFIVLLIPYPLLKQTAVQTLLLQYSRETESVVVYVTNF